MGAVLHGWHIAAPRSFHQTVIRAFAAAIGGCLIAATLVPLRAQSERPLSARLVSAPTLTLPTAVDSNTPMAWDLVDGVWTLFAVASWGGAPSLLAGPRLDDLQRLEAITLLPHPGYGVWMEAVIPDDGGTWYGYYHHEVPDDVCGRPDRSILSIGAARSRDRGLTWENLGVILESPPGSHACTTSNRFLVGGVGDPSVVLDADHRYLYMYFSQYAKERLAQGVAIARMPWADRDVPRGQIAVLHDGAWLPAKRVDDGSRTEWEYPAGTALVPVSNPWHDRDYAVDAFWGASIHWNTYLERYVMLLNRAKNENFDNEGIYVSYSRELSDAHAWSAPRKLMNGGGWYPQVVGLDTAGGTDREAGQRARFFLTGRSAYYIEFQR
jgi:hypothetical protein